MNCIAKPTLSSVSNTTAIADICAIINADGGVIVENYISAEQVRAFNEEIEPALAVRAAGSNPAKMQWERELAPDAPPEIWERAAEFGGRNTKRLEDLVNLSRTFREEILDLDLFHGLGDALLLDGKIGTYWMDEAQLIEIGPDSPAQPLHRDHEAWPLAAALGRAAPEVIVNFLIAMTDFTDENGATRVIPGSNRWPDFEDRGALEMTVPAEMQAGDALIFSGKVVHGGGANRTQDFYRRALTVPLLMGYLTPLDATALCLDKELVRGLPRRVQRLLGFRSHWFGGAPLWQVNGRDIGEHLGL